MDLWRDRIKKLFKKMSNFMKDNRYLWVILILVSLGIVFYLSYRITYGKLTSKPITIQWDNKGAVVASQEKVNITIHSKLKKNCASIEKVSYIMEFGHDFPGNKNLG